MFDKDPELLFQKHDPNSPHSILLGLFDKNETILDVGCNVGYIGEYAIKNKSCICDGVDCDADFLEKAKKKGYRELFNVDLYKADFKINYKYDTILFIDILEHLPNPYEILLKITNENLKPGGRAIICLPNIARGEHRLKHLMGNFEYEKSGIMHQDHLRFFTKKTASEMIEKTGLKIKKVLVTGMARKIKIFPTLTSFQFIFICRK